jgi:hypothetical protein
MKNNVINSQFAIEVMSTDSLEIIGKSRSAVVFKLTGTTAGELLRSHPAFCKNTIFTHEIGDGVGYQRNVLIFEYNLREELRNPRKLLKSVRNKLVQAGFRNMREDDREFNEMYSMTDRQEHQMFQ